MHATSRTNYINVLKINICTNLTLNIYFNICEVLHKIISLKNNYLQTKLRLTSVKVTKIVAQLKNAS